MIRLPTHYLTPYAHTSQLPPILFPYFYRFHNFNVILEDFYNHFISKQF